MTQVPDDMIGQTLGSYRVIARLGEGGMGVVYLAEHPLLGRKAAIKLLLPELTRNDEIVQRFFNEARAATMIKHPGIVDIFDFGHHPETGSAFIAMEFLEGESLAGRLRRGRLSVETAAGIGRQIARGLAAAHDKGIVHRDLKPDNLYLVPDADLPAGVRVKILDFGIAKLIHDGIQRTKAGSVFGTPVYMSPEQCRGAGEVDARADIYSLGCILFEMVAGRPPFTQQGFGEVIGAHMYEPPPRLRELDPAIAAGFEAIVMRTLAKQPGERPGTMEVLARELLAFSGVSHATPVSGVPIAGWTPPSATTLRAASGEAIASTATTAPRRRAPWIAAGVLGVGVVIGAAFAFRGGGGGGDAGEEPRERTPAAAPAPDARVEVATEPAIDAGIPIDAAAAAVVAAPLDAAPRVTTKRKPPVTTKPPKQADPAKGSGSASGSGSAGRDEDEFTR